MTFLAENSCWLMEAHFTARGTAPCISPGRKEAFDEVEIEIRTLNVEGHPGLTSDRLSGPRTSKNDTDRSEIAV